MFLLKRVHIWVHNRLCITPGAHSSLASLIYVSLISAHACIKCECSKWLTWISQSIIKHYRESQALRNCMDGTVVSLQQGHVQGCSYLLAPTYCQGKSKPQNLKTRLCCSSAVYVGFGNLSWRVSLQSMNHGTLKFFMFSVVRLGSAQTGLLLRFCIEVD